MEIGTARALALELLAQHGLVDWRITFGNAKRQAGVCRPSRKEIGLSATLTRLHSEDEVRDTILHEIAHALVGPQHGHDAVWRAKALEVGCTAERCVPESAPQAPAAWTGTCPNGHVASRHQQPTRVASCHKCSPEFDISVVIDWRFHGRQVRMHPNYEAELARLRERHGQRGVEAEAPTTAADARSSPDAAPAHAWNHLPLGSRVQVNAAGKYAGVVGTIVKRARTRYHVRTAVGVLTVPFALVTVFEGSGADE